MAIYIEIYISVDGSPSTPTAINYWDQINPHAVGMHFLGRHALKDYEPILLKTKSKGIFDGMYHYKGLLLDEEFNLFTLYVNANSLVVLPIKEVLPDHNVKTIGLELVPFVYRFIMVRKSKD